MTAEQHKDKILVNIHANNVRLLVEELAKVAAARDELEAELAALKAKDEPADKPAA